MGRRLSPATIFVLKALIPYSKSNLMLASTPNAFFNELEKLSRYNKEAIRSAYYRSVDKGYITRDGTGKMQLTSEGLKQIQFLEPKKLVNSKNLLVSFDIPEKKRSSRRFLRNTLRELGFMKLQNSVWVSDYDHTENIRQICEQLEIASYVKIFIGKLHDL